ncbi:Hint domain-containing protein [Loktanella sp. Alg231-35]|uniref:Hint domain-containing protein n=1 Tax=Loktanella sp. Alg231-35 TaxID=1922220 RepID=UPI000D557381|nr:Hint domain-containing protein [Loktanella sp. Alg231-35]
MTLRTFTGYLNSDLFGGQNPVPNGTFDTSTAQIQVLIEDGAGDFVVEGDSSGGSTNTESSEDAEGDQFVFLQDGSGTVLADGELFYLETSFEFTIAGQTFTGYHFEDENGLDFTILPPDVPDGIATIDSRDFSPSPDEVDYAALSSDDEDFDDDDFTALDFSGDDEIFAGDGDDVVNAGDGNDFVEGGIGSDVVNGGDGNDVIYGDTNLATNGGLDSDQADGTWSPGTVDGWFNSGSSGLIERWGDNFFGTSPDDNSTFVELDANSSGGLDHLQTNLELDTGIEYIITIDHAARPGTAANDDFEITHNGVVIATVSPTSVGSFTTTTVTINGLAGTDTIGFRELAGQNDSIGILLDNFTVSLSPAGAAASGDVFNDIIDGGDGDDIIYGQEGNDIITGGTGDDVMSGGIGDDVFVLADGSGSDIATDFEIGSDLLDVTGLTDADGNPVNVGDVTVTPDGEGGSILTFPNGEQIILRDIDPSDLDTNAELNDVGIPCFVSGTLIETQQGPMPVEALTAGTMVKVACGGFASLRLNLSRFVSSAELRRKPELLPIKISAGALGAELPVRDLWVSRQHRMLVNSPIAQRMFDTREALIAAVRLVDLAGIAVDDVRCGLSYHHLVFDTHQIVYAEGAPSESFLTGPEGLRALSDDARAEIYEIFPRLSEGSAKMAPARIIPSNRRQNALVARHQKNAKPMLEFA